MVSMAFAGGLATGALRSKERREDQEFDLAKATAKAGGKGLTADQIKTKLAEAGYDSKKLAALANVTDVNVLLPILGGHKKSLVDTKNQVTLSAARQDAEGTHGAFAIPSSDKSFNLIIPSMSGIIKSVGGGTSAADIQAIGTNSTKARDTLYTVAGVLDTVLSRDKDISKSNLEAAINSRLSDLAAFPQLPQYGVSSLEGAKSLFPRLYERYAKDPDKLRIITGLLEQYKLFQPTDKKSESTALNNNTLSEGSIDTTRTEINQQEASRERAKNPEIPLVRSPIKGHSIGASEQVILQADKPEHANKAYNRDEEGAYPRFGLSTTVSRLRQATRQTNIGRYDAVAEAFVNPTQEAESVIKRSSPFALLRDHLKTGPLNRHYIVHEQRRGSNLVSRHEQYRHPDEKKLLKEEEMRKPLFRQYAALSNAKKTVDDIELIAEHVGLMISLDTTDPNASIHDVFKGLDQNELDIISGKLFDRLIKDKGTRMIVDADGKNIMMEVSKNNFHNAIMTEIEQKNARIKKYFAGQGVAAVLSPTAAGGGSLLDNIMANIQGAFDVFHTYLDYDKELYERTYGTDFKRARDTLSARGIDFDKHLNDERGKLQKSMEDYQTATDSRAKALAFARAQMSFYKINLAYQYAAISQGGEGSARTISDTDFAKNFQALFQESGEAFLGVVRIIQRQTEQQLEASRVLLSEIGEGDYNKIAGEINELGLSISFSHSLRDKRVTPRTINTIGGQVRVLTSPRDGGKAEDAAGEPKYVQSFYNHFPDLHTDRTSTIQRQGASSFKFDFKNKDEQDVFKLRHEKNYRPRLKKLIMEHMDKRFFGGGMPEEKAIKRVNKNLPQLMRYVYDPILLDNEHNNPFWAVTLKDIKGLKFQHYDFPIATTIKKWSNRDLKGNYSRFDLAQQGRLYSVPELEKQKDTLKAEEFMLKSLAHIVLRDIVLNWDDVAAKR